MSQAVANKDIILHMACLHGCVRGVPVSSFNHIAFSVMQCCIQYALCCVNGCQAEQS